MSALTDIQKWPQDKSPMPAAGPWRFDVENAPKDGTEVLVAVDSGGPIIFVVGPITEADLRLTPIIAFATINPPETQE